MSYKRRNFSDEEKVELRRISTLTDSARKKAVRAFKRLTKRSISSISSALFRASTGAYDGVKITTSAVPLNLAPKAHPVHPANEVKIPYKEVSIRDGYLVFKV